MSTKLSRIALGSTLGLSLLLAGCERPPVDSVQLGYRGTAMEEIINPRAEAKLEAENKVPPATPQAPGSGPKAGDTYQNVQVLGDLSVAQFTRFMVSMTQWVSPKQGCNYCHEVGNMASDSMYTKMVARRMIQMTRYVNNDWQDHVAATGVTCYTCHRGQPVPNNVWFTQQSPSLAMVGAGTGQNLSGDQVGRASLPNDPFTPYLLGEETIRVGATQALPSDYKFSIQDTERSYGLMIHMSESLGVNCTYCHNSRSFGSWKTSTPQRVTAWYGIRMVRALNLDYLEPLQPVFPDKRLGKLGDVAKINCGTCHQGVYKPLYGQNMLKDFTASLRGSLMTTQAGDGTQAVMPNDAMHGGGAPSAYP